MLRLKQSLISARIDADCFDEMVVFLQRYAIIKACGTIEYVVKNFIADYVEQGSKDEISAYITKTVRESSSNPKTGAISELLGSFSSDVWRKRFDEEIKNMNAQKNSLNSLVQLRNDFAHGKSPNTSIATIIQYYTSSCSILVLVDKIISGQI